MTFGFRSLTSLSNVRSFPRCRAASKMHAQHTKRACALVQVSGKCSINTDANIQHGAARTCSQPLRIGSCSGTSSGHGNSQQARLRNGATVRWVDRGLTSAEERERK
eukprot:6204742-Pleurochrysis_carterae.AAC.1